ncbi:DUF1552 domain-containing protein [Wenyingzhuangia aestuarii]|uniref:DUF1552 domain-containing protein n=1 Tax=Wenyingzhuangia aestuarii TaxID=1647582 RepID=UPI00143C100E|nr:DUF1552 domain-containing protein [Wenyingzhuangia aestuarii]NJB83540.1 hypothetical protein [Wenyingzhuangia aestuarii]
MSKKSWHMDRRSFVKGLGVACMLPYLECMGMSSLSVLDAPSKVDIPKRLCYLYVPNGVAMPPKESEYFNKWNWFPTGKGANYKFTNTLSSLEPHRKDISILGGLSHPFSRSVLGHIAGDTWLTGGDLRGAYKNSVSVDQVAARHLAKNTRFPSLVLSTDGGVGYKSRASTLSFDSSGKAIPSEHRQREIFERYFSPNGGGTTAQRRKSLQQGKKLVDLILEDSKSLNRKLGAHDKAKMDEYLTSLNRVEEQVVRNEKWLDIPLKKFDSDHLNLDVSPQDPEAYIKATLDLMVIGLQTDATRVMTYMMAREDGMGFGDSFPKFTLGLPGHHSMSHDKTAGHWEEWGKYDQWLAKQFAYFIERLKTTTDEYGPLLDNTMVLYGSACSSTHNANNCPLVLAGGKNMGAKHGTYTEFDQKHVPMSNLFVSMLNSVGLETEKFADSTGTLPSILT